VNDVAWKGLTPFSVREIGDYFELHYSRVSRIIKAKSKA
jgi:DNA-directed RNA polymerase specialized sigma54-like protein